MAECAGKSGYNIFSPLGKGKAILGMYVTAASGSETITTPFIRCVPLLTPAVAQVALTELNITEVKGVVTIASTGDIAAQGTITMAGLAVTGETFVIDTQTFIWKAARSAAGEVTIGANAPAAVTNIVTAVTADLATVTAVDGALDTVVVKAATPGAAGNSIVFTEASTNMTVDGAGTLGTTTAGVDTSPTGFQAIIMGDLY